MKFLVDAHVEHVCAAQEATNFHLRMGCGHVGDFLLTCLMWRVFAVGEDTNLHLEYYQRLSQMKYVHPGNFLMTSVLRSFSF